MRTLSTRVQDWLHREILDFARAQEEGPSEALRRVAEEWWAMRAFPDIEYRDGVSGRRAGLRDGPDVWEVVMVWKDYPPEDRDALHAHFKSYVSAAGIDQALAYYERFPDEVDRRLALQERLAARLGGAETR